MTAPLLTFDQAIPHLRRGFIVRIHGHDKLEGALIQEQKGALELSFGDGKWGSVDSVPLLDLAFDVYDQKREPSPELAKLESAVATAPFKVGDRVKHREDNTVGVVKEVDGEQVLVHFEDVPEGDEDDELHDAKDLVLDDGVELGGGNHPAPAEPASTEAHTSPEDDEEAVRKAAEAHDPLLALPPTEGPAVLPPEFGEPERSE